MLSLDSSLIEEGNMASPAPAWATSSASITLNLFDGTRRPLRTKSQLLVRIRDGNQNDIHSGFHKGSSLVFENLPFYNNFGDNYTVLVSAKGYFQAGFTPVQVAPNIPRVLDLMMIAKNGVFNFRNATWQRLKSSHPVLSALLAAVQEPIRRRGRDTKTHWRTRLHHSPVFLTLSPPFGISGCLREPLWIISSRSFGTIPSGRSLKTGSTRGRTNPW